MPKPVRCPACKIILDGGRLVASAERIASWLRAETILSAEQPDHHKTNRALAASYLAAIVRATTDAIVHGIKSGFLTPEQIDAAHAWSELQCHRAAALESGEEITGDVLDDWAQEERLRATEMFGGEYEGAWIVDGVKGISRKPSA